MTNARITAFDSRATMLAAAYAYSLGALENAIKNRGEAVFLGAGGSTPAPLYALLSAAEIDWANIRVGLTDERWVPLSHPASNGAMIGKQLLQNAASSAHFVSMIPDQKNLGPKPEAGDVQLIEEAYEPLTSHCDLMILGMGPDAHTLSWFQGAEGIEAALAPNSTQTVAAIEAIPSPTTGENTSRITLTYRAVTLAKRVLLLITGEEKRAVFETASAGTPIQHMINAAGDRLTTYWAP